MVGTYADDGAESRHRNKPTEYISHSANHLPQLRNTVDG